MILGECRSALILVFRVMDRLTIGGYSGDAGRY